MKNLKFIAIFLSIFLSFNIKAGLDEANAFWNDPEQTSLSKEKSSAQKQFSTAVKKKILLTQKQIAAAIKEKALLSESFIAEYTAHNAALNINPDFLLCKNEYKSESCLGSSHKILEENNDPVRNDSSNNSVVAVSARVGRINNNQFLKKSDKKSETSESSASNSLTHSISKKVMNKITAVDKCICQNSADNLDTFHQRTSSDDDYN